MPSIPIELKVKIKSLAEEARIIRKEERKLPGGMKRNTVHNHRVIDVRRAQRSSLLAYGYLRGRAYRRIESITRCDKTPYDRPGPDWTNIAGMVIRYGPVRTEKKEAHACLIAWRDAKQEEQVE